MSERRTQIRSLKGPILVLGASGFIGANLLRRLLAEREDVFGTASPGPAWRLEGIPPERIAHLDLLVSSSLESLLDRVRPQTVFNCVAYGAYSFEREADRIYQTNVGLTARLLEALDERGVHRYIHAGSSSEYGTQSAGPTEEVLPLPNSHYAASKVSAAAVIQYMGQHRGMAAANLRLYSVYGPYEDSSRLIPTLVANGARGELPEFVDPEISRDFVYVDDACDAFVAAAAQMRPEHFGHSFNIGSGRKTTIREVAEISRRLFGIERAAVFSMQARDWDVTDWYADTVKTEREIGWRATVSFADGLHLMAQWYEGLPDTDAYSRSSKRNGPDTRHSVSAIIACYLDGQAIPIMYERLTKTFVDLGVDYEIIFVNDGSPDDAQEVIRALSARDRRVIGITHSRNFGSQAAFRSGMELATKNSCVLLDGDLQDPPELIVDFLARWREGYDVVYGRRVKREAPWYMQAAYKLFYRVFDRFSYLKIPHDAGDFSLLDRSVVEHLLALPERDQFLRGLRAFVGFEQTGIDYVRPERVFGKTTNSLWKNIGWAKKGILSFSHTPLNILSFCGVLLFGLFAVLGLSQVVAKLLVPDSAPAGITTVVLVVLGLGALNLLGISLLGEYIAKIFEEVKRRPRFIRRSVIQNGELHDAGTGMRRVPEHDGTA